MDKNHPEGFSTVPEEQMGEKNELSSFQLKMQLLRNLKEGNINEVHSLLSLIKEKTKINSEMYEKFDGFVRENK